MKLAGKQKKVLIVTYYFPPSGGAGVQRTLKFVKYLRDFGWEPVVLTAKNADYPAYDESLCAEIPPGIKIYRSNILEPYRMYRRFTRKKIGESTDISTLTLNEKEQQKLNERISEWIRATFFIPDARIFWFPFAFSKGLKILRKERINLIFSSAPPYTSHLIGMMLHRFSGIPWIADFRDSWIGWFSTPQWRPVLSRAVEFWMESSVLRYADRILTVSKGVHEDLLSRHPQRRNDEWRFLPNGYDEDDFSNLKPLPKNDRLTIVYTGSLFGNLNLEYLLQALEHMHQKKPDLLKKIYFLFVGRIGHSILERIRSSPVSFIFKYVGYVKHSESINYLKKSDVSLLIIDYAPILTGKLFEYIAAGHTILALAPEGDAADLIRSHNIGRVVSPKNVEKIYETIVNLIDDYEKNKNSFSLDRSILKKFERKTLTKELTMIFNELIFD